ncbi:MAG: hypothetical protein M0Q91_00185 [Methanoregula sp.]|nr:hypothetical protein [Methanoregula sp.]
MKKTMAARIFWVGAGACVIASGLYFIGMIPLSVCAAVVVPAFSVTVLALFFWWMAGQSGGDIPFIGY